MMSSMFRTREPIGRRDVAIAAVLSLLGLVLMYQDANNHKIDASYLAMPVFPAVTIPVLWRRAAPLAALAAVLVSLAVHIALFGTVTRCGVAFPVIFVLIFAAGARLEPHRALIALALGIGAIAVMASADSQVNERHAAPFACSA